ncbi:MAG: sensor histidine kinase [Mucilaginibacter sp.]|nr:sensor histidine kinase [Mucilaginibacter sp.]
MPNKGDHNILVIEDNPGDFALVEEFLLEQIEAPIISHAQDYKAAKEILAHRDHPFDIILLDLSLPDKTGLPLIQEVIEIALNASVIVLTGYADFEFGVKSLSIGVSDYILKEEITSLSLYKSIVYSTERKKIISALEISEMRARSFAKQLNNVLEEERARIAREIHDEFGQQLSGLKMSLTSLKKNEGVRSDVAPIIDVIVADVNTSIQSLRQIANELRPVLIDKLGLFAAIEWLVSEFEKKTGISSRIYVDIDQPVINKMLEINIFRICQEALTNITKHAEATMVNFRIENNTQILTIRIIDNGKGIKASTLHNPLSMGLLNMRERANLIGAEINITSSFDKGTVIELIVSTNGKENINSRRSFSN